MILYEDTRQKSNKHDNVHRYCKDNSIDIVPMYLNVGDYMLPNGKTSVDTKADLLELANDLYRDKLAFNKKYKKCLADGIKLIVLVEQPITSLSQLLKWTNSHTKVTGKMLYDMMKVLQLSYGVQFCFCSKDKTGENIIKLLNS